MHFQDKQTIRELLNKAEQKCMVGILTELYKVANESVDKTLTLTAEDIKLIATRYGVKIGEEK